MSPGLPAPDSGVKLPAQISSALQRLDSWIEEQGFRGWDPHDALNSSLIRRLSAHNRLAAIFWLQLLKRSPFNFRPLLGIAKDYNPKGMGLFLASYARKYAITQAARHRERVLFIARWLLENAARDHNGMSWGYNFDWANRAFFAPAGTPTLVNTAFIALGFLDLHVLLGNQLEWSAVTERLSAPGCRRISSGSTIASALKVARSACDFILRDLNAMAAAPDEICFSYTPLDRRAVHNANMMGAWLLASVFRLTGEPQLRTAALAASRFTTRRQKATGAWPYGEAARDGWVDNFHTGFVLVALKRTAECLRTDEFDACVSRGYSFWKTRMFLADGTPKYYPHSTYPVDVHSAAQAILTFLEFQDKDSEALEHAIQVARWSVDRLQDSSGYFHYQIRHGYRIRIPYIRWSQAWMQRALTGLVHSAGDVNWQ